MAYRVLEISTVISVGKFSELPVFLTFVYKQLCLRNRLIQVIKKMFIPLPVIM